MGHLHIIAKSVMVGGDVVDGTLLAHSSGFIICKYGKLHVQLLAELHGMNTLTPKDAIPA